MTKTNRTIRIMVMVAMYVALAVTLDVIKEFIAVLDMPQGGSINIALIPVVLASFHLGPVLGMGVGALWMLVSFLITPPYLAEHYVILGFMLDYVVPSIIIGAAAFLYKKKANIVMMEAGIVITMIIRTLSIIISGVYAWPGDAAAGSPAAWTGSLAYNLPYCLATAGMLLVVTPILCKVFEKQFAKTL